MDRKDGSYVVRYKMFSTAEDLMIDILYGGRHVASSPYTLKGRNNKNYEYCKSVNNK